MDGAGDLLLSWALVIAREGSGGVRWSGAKGEREMAGTYVVYSRVLNALREWTWQV